MRFQQITTKIIYEIQIELCNSSLDIEEDKISCGNLNYSVLLSPFSIYDDSVKTSVFLRLRFQFARKIICLAFIC